MPRWNEGWRGHQRSAGWGQISHYLPHKPSRCETKVRQAGGHSWAQRLKHPSGKWPAFDQACHFCHEGDPHDQTMPTGQSLRPWRRLMARIHALSLSLRPPSQVKLQEMFYFSGHVSLMTWGHTLREICCFCVWPKPALLHLPLSHSLTSPWWGLITETGRNKLRYRVRWGGRDTADRSIYSNSAGHTNSAPSRRLLSGPWSCVPLPPLLPSRPLFAFSTIGGRTDTQVN